MKFRKRPVVIEAVQLTPLNLEEVERFVGGDLDVRAGVVTIATLEGAMRASIGDWIIKGVKGEFCPCKPDIFAATYEAADEASPGSVRAIGSAAHSHSDAASSRSVTAYGSASKANALVLVGTL